MATDEPRILGRARELVDPALRLAVGRLSPLLVGAASYHFGWTDRDGRAVGTSGGKGVRPALAVLSAEAVGAAASDGVPGAVAVELVHNYSLLHDDIIDGDKERRHRETVWSAYSVGDAIIVGDAMATLAYQVLFDEPGSGSVAAARELTTATAAMIEGQAEDMDFDSRPSVTLEECLAMEARKTGALLSCAAAIGALLAAGEASAIDALRRYGLELGMAFQAVDDLLGIWGDPDETGKPASSDLRERKRSMPITAALASDGPASTELADLLGQVELSEHDLVRAAELVESAGGRDVTTDLADHHLANALDALSAAPLAESAATDLAELAIFATTRRY